MRAIIGDLRPPALEELGLLSAVELLLQRSRAESPEITLVVQGTERRLAPQSELAVFRIIQEAWSNIRHHAQARRADFTFSYDADGLHVTISDDGRGFVPLSDTDAPDGHWGLRGMRERSELTGGTYDIGSTSGRGTQIHICIPLPWRRRTRSRLWDDG